MSAIGTKRTWQRRVWMSAIRVGADVALADDRYYFFFDFSSALLSACSSSRSNFSIARHFTGSVMVLSNSL